MRRSTPWIFASLMAIGCGGNPPAPAPAKPAEPAAIAPKKGDKVITKSFADVWELPRFLVQSREIIRESGLKSFDPALKPKLAPIDRFRVGFISPGDLFEVVEVGPDFAGIDVIEGGSIRKDDDGEPGAKRLHGYVEAWW